MLLFRLEFAYQFYQYESLIAPADCDCENFEEVLLKIPEHVKVLFFFLVFKIHFFKLSVFLFWFFRVKDCFCK